MAQYHDPNTTTAALLMRPKAWHWSCGGISPAGVQAASDSEPGMSDKLEAVLMLGSGLRDGDGNRLSTMQIPPALALAIIRTLERKGEMPQAVAHRIVMGSDR